MARNTSFYYSFLFLPAALCHALVAVWDVCRAGDDAVEAAPAAGGQPCAREGVAFWRAELARAFEGGVPETRQGRALQPLVRAFDLPRQAFEDVIDGCAMDLDTTRYATFTDLFEYCRRVASAVGMICIRIFGCRDSSATEYALNLGVALQLTNILRDVKTDLARGRVYLPLDDLKACGCSVEDWPGVVRNRCAGRRVRCRREGFLPAREGGHAAGGPEAPVAAGSCVRCKLETLRRIERSGYDIFTARARVRARGRHDRARQWMWTCAIRRHRRRASPA